MLRLAAVTLVLLCVILAAFNVAPAASQNDAAGQGRAQGLRPAELWQTAASAKKRRRGRAAREGGGGPQHHTAGAPANPASAVSGQESGAKLQLAAGNIRADLTGLNTEGTHAAGSSGFAQIKLSAESKTGRGAAELVLEAEHAEILGVTGLNVKTSRDGNKLHARFDDVRRGKDPRPVLVEVLLKETSGQAPNTLKISLRDPSAAGGASGDGTAISWTVRNCAGDFYKELRKIHESGAARITKILDEIRTPDKASPDFWYFRPSASLGIASAREDGKGKRRCTRWGKVKYKYGRRGRRKCLESAEAGEDGGAAPASRREREVLLEASALVSARGADKSLGAKTPAGWVMQKSAGDLKIYLEQKQHPAMCTGAVQFATYYLNKLSGLKKRIDTLSALAAEARALARGKADEARSLATETPGGHPGWGGAPLAIALPGGQGGAGAGADGSRDFRPVIANLAMLAGLEEAKAKAMGEAAGDLAALALFREAWEDAAGKLTPDVRIRIQQALSAIEAAAHLGGLERRHEALRSTFLGGLQAIHESHDRICVCKS